MVTAINPDGSDLSSAVLRPGSGSWEMTSDVAAKANLEPVDPAVVLQQLARLPIQTWNYRAQPAEVRHMGPTAQDFQAAFQIGASDRTIAAVDADGVALAAIQALHQHVLRQEREIQALQEQLRALEGRWERAAAKAD